MPSGNLCFKPSKLPLKLKLCYFRYFQHYQLSCILRQTLLFHHRDFGRLGLVVFGQGDVVVDAVLAAPLSGLPPQDGGADELDGGEDDEADAGREEREEPEESGRRFNGIHVGKKFAHYHDSY